MKGIADYISRIPTVRIGFPEAGPVALIVSLIFHRYVRVLRLLVFAEASASFQPHKLA